MKIDNVVEVFSPERIGECSEVVAEDMNAIDVGVRRKDRAEGLFGQIMHLGRDHLLFQTTDYRGGQYDIPDGAETYDEKLHGSPPTTARSASI